MVMSNYNGETVIAEVESLLLGDAHVVRIHLEDGTTGIGQSAFWGYPAAIHAMMEYFRPALIGEDGMRREHIAQLLYRMGPFRGAALSAAVAAVDIALWDIVGKRMGVPVWQLLGGRVRDRVRLHKLIDGMTPETILAECVEAAEMGFTAVKFDPVPSDYFDLTTVALVGQIRDVVGEVRAALPATDLILELHRKFTPAQAIAVGRTVGDFDLAFWEDPIQIDTMTTQVAVAEAVGLPIGLGERFHTVWEFREFLEQGAVHFVRPDVGLAGGISGVRKIAVLAEAHHSALSLHNCLGPLLTAATLHVDVAIPNFSSQDYTLLDEGLTDFTTGGPVRDGGFLLLPEAPGLGIELVEDPQPQQLVARRIHEVPIRGDGSPAYSV
ncbi:MAG: galactokinase [Acidimicrobiia bacterium]|nr:galactokinase [Acidimicrobiia bacterium]